MIKLIEYYKKNFFITSKAFSTIYSTWLNFILKYYLVSSSKNDLNNQVNIIYSLLKQAHTKL